MGLSGYLNENILNEKLSDLLYRYDCNRDGFNKKEYNDALHGIVNIWTYGFAKMTGFDKKLFKDLDRDISGNVSYNEMADYIRDEYGLELSLYMDKTVKQICDEIDEINAQRKKKKRDVLKNEWNG